MGRIRKYNDFLAESKALSAFDPQEAEQFFAGLDDGDIPDCVPTNAREWRNLASQLERINRLLDVIKDGGSVIEVLNKVLPGVKSYIEIGKIDMALKDYVTAGIYKKSIYELIDDLVKHPNNTPYHSNKYEEMFADLGLPLRVVPFLLTRIYKSLDDESKSVKESAAPLSSAMLLVYGKEKNGKKRLYIAKVKGGGVYKRNKAEGPAKSATTAHLSNDELYIVKEKDGKLVPVRCATTGATDAMGLSSWSVVLNDNKTPYHWTAMKEGTPVGVIKALEHSIRAMPDIDLS